MQKTALFIALMFLTLLATNSFSQTANITLGNGTGTNSSTSYPAPYGNWYWGAKHQFIVNGAELSAAGMTAGDIVSLGFDVANANGTVLEDFVIQIGTTTKTQWVQGDDFESALTTVYGPTNYTETNGVNVHTFNAPYFWDGSSNLVISTCFNNTSYTNNAQVYFSTTTNDMTMFAREDNQNVCSLISGGFAGFQTSDARPNMIFEVVVPGPPVTNFNASTTNTCSGEVDFFDQSSYNPSSWSWDFGDGNTSTLQNPSHTYTASGNYTVTLSATNSIGTDTEVKTNYISVNLAGVGPVTNSCTPVTVNGTLGFGITNVTFNTLNKSSGDASEGYGDFTCDQTTVFAGQDYTFSATHPNPTTHNCGAWIDWNNDGVFNPSTEEIASSSSSTVTTATVTVPSNAVLNTPLRMRVFADYDLSNVPAPCTDPEYGQVEDYTIIVEQEAVRPEADFASDVLKTCDGTVSFTDLSTNIPYAWYWEFGDGNTSVQINPTHTYTADGTYDVQLISTNAYGSDTILKVGQIEVALSQGLTAATCEPSTLNHCCDYGIYQVAMNNINHTTSGGEDGYQDYSCEYNTVLQSGNNYGLSIKTGASNPQDTRVWIDFNNDGEFTASELVLEALNTTDPNSFVSIPTTGVVLDTYLRMRVSSDELGGQLDGCGNHLRGQTEDYGVLIEAAGNVEEPSTVDFKVYPNPNDGLFSISANDDIQSVTIVNLIGEVFYNNIQVQGTNPLIDLSNLAKGTYLVKLTDNKGAQGIEKVIVK